MWVTLASSPLEVAKTPTINHIEVQTIWHGPRPQVNREALMQQATPRAWLSPLRAEGRDQTPLGRQFILRSSPLPGSLRIWDSALLKWIAGSCYTGKDEVTSSPALCYQH